MKRREFSLALAAGTLATTPAWSQNAFRNGKDYLTLDKPVASESGNGKIEVIEFFWYSCPHCNSFEPAFERWAKAVPKDVVVRRMHVSFRPDFEPQQRLYFTLEAMNLLETIHPKVFQAIHVEKLPLNTDAAILSWVERQGVDKARFAETAKSFGVATKARRAVQLQNEFRIEGVPSLGVAGRFYIDGSLAGSMDRALKVAESLIAQTRGR
jgi:thiol:disulfide interchange protein DsbA